MSLERLDKILSHEGFGSRKDVKKLLHAKAVQVNGQTVVDPSMHIDTLKDQLIVDGEVITFEKNVYLMMNKPGNVVCANKDGLHQTVFSLLDETYQTGYFLDHLHLIGRLDLDTEGLLIFTTDGALTHKLISPKTHCTKKYFVRLDSEISLEEKENMTSLIRKGFVVCAEDNDGEFTSLPAEIEFTDNASEVFLSIVEGKYHQVKRMFRTLGKEVVYLKRVSIGSLKLDESLELGQYRKMTFEEASLMEREE